ncbi:CAP domain-containing protein [Gorgonomyces haynaldii]|nr:CAP domain-containing protein [Gorgonomyces haynaldii]
MLFLATASVLAQDITQTGKCYLANRKDLQSENQQQNQQQNQPQQQNDNNGGDSSCLGIINGVRQKIGVSSLSWSNSLANGAYNQAKWIATQNGGRLQHGSAAENIAGTGSCSGAVSMWSGERGNYWGFPIGQYPISRYGHWTQLVWPSATVIGCGGYGNIYVCRWDTGNQIGVRLTRY